MRETGDADSRHPEREMRWLAAERAMVRLQADADAWADYQAEAVLWESTSADGLDDLPYDLDERSPTVAIDQL